MEKKIFLSPSNQTENSYAYGGTNEAVECGKMAVAAKTALERCGFSVRMNHLGTLAEKVAASNSWGADLHIAIHTNAYNGKVSGTRMFYYAEGTNSKKACKAIFDVLSPLTPGASENTRAYPGLYEMRMTNATSVYIEVDFHDVPTTARWLTENTETVGEAIAEGVCNFYGVAYKAPAEKPEAPQTPKNPKPAAVQLFGEAKTYRNGTTREIVYGDTGLTVRVGTLNPRETCRCLGTVNGRYLVLYPVDGTNQYKTGFVRYKGI